MNLYVIGGALGLAASLTAALTYSISLNLEAREAMGAVRAEIEARIAEGLETTVRLRASNAARKRLNSRLDSLESERQDLYGSLQSERAKRQQREDDDERYRRWATAGLPDSVVGMLQQSPLYPGHRVPDVRHDKAAGDPDAAPEPATPEHEQQPDRFD